MYLVLMDRTYININVCNYLKGLLNGELQLQILLGTIKASQVVFRNEDMQLLLKEKLCNAMVTNHLRAPYGVYFTKNRTILQRPYGARPAAGRIVPFFINFLDIVRCPVKFRYYLKFHGARTAFGRVNKGKMTSAGHRTYM